MDSFLLQSTLQKYRIRSNFTILNSYFYYRFCGYINMMRNQRRIGEALMIASGIGVAAAGLSLGVMPLLYGGLAIAGLAIFSVFWDW
jgi:hypothetical protein